MLDKSGAVNYKIGDYECWLKNLVKTSGKDVLKMGILGNYYKDLKNSTEFNDDFFRRFKD